MSNSMAAPIEDHLSALIGYRTTANRPDELDRICAYVAAQLRTIPWLTVKDERLAGKPLVWGYASKPNPASIWLVTHLDVVPGISESFVLTKDTRNYYGRGVLDMKGIAASIIAALQQLQRPLANLAFVFSTDEETGGASMAEFVEKHVRSGKAALALDGGEHWTIEEQSKGIVHLRVTAAGAAAHGARPWLGENAIERLLACETAFAAWFRQTINAPDSKQYEDTTYNLGTIQGGTATNQVPATASLTLDIRYTRRSDHDAVITWFAQYQTNHTYITTHITVEGAPAKVLLDLPQVQAFATVLQSMNLKASGNERYAYGGTDGRFFAAKDIAIIVTRPPGAKQHTDAEWVSRKGLEQLSEAVKTYIQETAS